MENPNQNPNRQPIAQVERKSHLDKLAEVFLPSDLDTMGDNIMNTIIVPTILKSAGDILIRCIDTIFGTNYAGMKAPNAQQTSVPYTAYASQQKTTQTVTQSGTLQILPVRQGVYDYANVKFATKDDAIRVLNNMRAIIQNTTRVSVGQYLELANCKTNPTDFNYGWTNLTTVKLQYTGDQNFPYRMILPPCIALNNSQIEDMYI